MSKPVKYTLRAVLAVSMLVGVYVFSFAILAFLVLAIYELISHGLSGATLGYLVVLTLVVAYAVGRGLFRRERDASAGWLVGEVDQPLLWEQVRSLAAQAQTRPPDEVRLVPVVNAAVSEASSWLGLRPGTRRLYLGVPLLIGLSTDQLRAVLAHEFGHYSGRHTALAAITYRGQESLERMVEQFGPRTVLGRAYLGYATVYLAVSSSVNRRQELEADQLSARLVGARTAAFTLTQVTALHAAWQGFLEAYAGMGEARQRRPDDLMEGFAWYWSSPTRQRELSAVRTATPREPSRFDSHPPTAERVAILEAMPDERGSDDSGLALELLTDYERTLRDFESWLYADAGAEPVAFADLAPVEATDQVTHTSATLLERMRAAGTQADLEGVVAELRSGRGIELARLVHPDGDRLELTDLASRLVGDLVAGSLVAEGRARFELSWDGPWRLLDPGGQQLDPWARAAAAVTDPLQVDSFVEWLVELDVTANWSPQVAEPGAPGSPVRLGPPEVYAVAVGIQGRTRSRILFVTDLGLFVKQMGLAESFGGGIKQGTTDAYVAMMRQCALMDVAALQSDPRARFTPWAAVQGVGITGRKLRLERADGDHTLLRIKTHAVDGDLVGSLRHFLDERLTMT